MTLCRNLTAANCTPACAFGAHMNSIMRFFTRDSVSHCSRSFLFVHLCSKERETSAPAEIPKFVCMTHSLRKSSGYAPASVCTAILTVQALSSFNRPTRMSRDCSATRNGNNGSARARLSHQPDTSGGSRVCGEEEEEDEDARFVRASTAKGARAIPKCNRSSTQRRSNESFEPAAVLSSVLHRIGIGCGWASSVSRRAVSRSACSFESAGTLSAAVSAWSGSIDTVGFFLGSE